MLRRCSAMSLECPPPPASTPTILQTQRGYLEGLRARAGELLYPRPACLFCTQSAVAFDEHTMRWCGYGVGVAGAYGITAALGPGSPVSGTLGWHAWLRPALSS